MEKIKILQVVPNMQQGGIENFIMNVYRKIDREKIQFDFLVHYNKRCFFDDEIESLGGKIYRFPVMEDKNIFKYIRDLKKFFKEHSEYKVVHGHMASLGFIYLGIAKKYGVKNRIAHSHGTSHLKTIKGYLKYFLFKLIKYKANIYMACSNEAGKYLFKNRNFEIIPNAIDIKKYEYKLDIREKLRDKFDINNKFVIGNVGRFNLQKNHTFLIDIFKYIADRDNDAILILIGTGELEQEIKEKINRLNLDNKVKFLGIRDDVDCLYQIMDVLVMPSLFEGLPVTGIEAQISGLQCVFSDSVTKEVDISKKSKFISLKETPEAWSNYIMNYKNMTREKSNIKNSMFDIDFLASELEKKYTELYLGKDKR